jgi:FKBP-type peptidyl-prolyl cis-trans isomerase
MKRIVIALAFAAAALSIAGCEKAATAGTNDANKKYFDAWRITNYPDAVRVDPGYYIISETPGTGVLAGTEEDNYFVNVEYTTYDLDGNIQSTTDAKTAQQLGSYSSGYYYGPKVLSRGNIGMTAGLDAAIGRMRMGGECKVIIPGWLNATASQATDYLYPRYDTEEDYLEKCTGTNVIYDLKLVEGFNNVSEWECDSLRRYAQRIMPGVDTLKYGFYYNQTQAPAEDADSLITGDVIYVNYYGRLLNGQMFATTVADSAKFYDIYDASTTYETQAVYIDAEDYTNVKLGTSSDGDDCVDGFAYAVSRMRVGEKGTALFYSGYGYKYSGSGSVIPPYSPLRFDFEIVSKKE